MKIIRVNWDGTRIAGDANVRDLIYYSIEYEGKEGCKQNMANLLALLTQKLVDANMISAEELRQAIETHFYLIED